METCNVRILQINKTIFDGESTGVTIPGVSGEMQILPGHEPMVTALKEGVITILSGDDTEEVSIEHGYAEVTPSQVTIIL